VSLVLALLLATLLHSLVLQGGAARAAAAALRPATLGEALHHAASTGTDLMLSGKDARTLCDLLAAVEVEAKWLEREGRMQLGDRYREIFER
jgi:hypothetical protein